MHLILRYSISIITSIFTLRVVILVQEETSLEAKRKHNIARNELLKSMIGLVCFNSFRVFNFTMGYYRHQEYRHQLS